MDGTDGVGGLERELTPEPNFYILKKINAQKSISN